MKWAAPRPTACSPCSKANAWAPAPIRQCCWSTTAPCAASHEPGQARPAVDGLKNAARPGNAEQVLSQFRATGVQTAFTAATSTPRSMPAWTAQLAPEGTTRSARRLSGAAQDPGDGGERLTQDQVIATVKESPAAWPRWRRFPTGLKWSFMPPVPGQKYLVCNSGRGEPGTCRTATSCSSTRTSSSRA